MTQNNDKQISAADVYSVGYDSSHIYISPEAAVQQMSEQLNGWMFMYLSGGVENIRKLQNELSEQWAGVSQNFFQAYLDIQSKENIDEYTKRSFAKLPYTGEHIFHMHLTSGNRLRYLFASKNVAETINDPIQLRLNHYIGNAFRDIGEFEQALLHYRKCESGSAIMITDKNADSIHYESLAYAQTCAADVLTKLGRPKESSASIEACRKQFNKFAQMSSERLEPALQGYGAINLLNSGKLNKAESACNEAINSAERIASPILSNAAQTTLAQTYIMQGQLDKARSALETCLKNADSYGDQRAGVEVLRHLAELYFVTDEKDLSYGAYSRLASQAQSFGNIRLANEALKSVHSFDRS